MIANGLKTKFLTKDDVIIFEELIKLFLDVFDEEQQTVPNSRYLERFLQDDNFVVCAAIVDGQTVGGLTGYKLQKYYSEELEFFIYDVAVARQFQRNGIGSVLLKELQNYCGEQGIREIFVMANEEDSHAVEFYQSAGGVAEKVVNFNFSTSKISN